MPSRSLVDPDDWLLDEQQLAPTSIDYDAAAAALQSLALQAPRPNPVTLRCELRYYLPTSGEVDLTVYDVTGRKVRTLVHERQELGSRRIWWDRRDGGGRKVSPGVYFARLRAPQGELSQRLVVLD